MSTARYTPKMEILHTKFNKSTTLKLRNVAEVINWVASVQDIAQQLQEITTQQLADKYVWMIGENPAYFLQYQVDSYAIIKGRGRVILVWKPKYIQFPTVVKPLDFGEQPKRIKSMGITVVESIGASTTLADNIQDFIFNYYGLQYFANKQEKFQTNLMTELKSYVSRVSKTSYWHCGIDGHKSIAVSSKGGPYLKFRIKGVREKYDKDIIVFSQQGKRDYALKGKSVQIISFLAMLMIFISVISCGEQDHEGICSIKNQMMVGGAAIMMGLMGLRVANRTKNKKKLDQKIKKLQSEQNK